MNFADRPIFVEMICFEFRCLHISDFKIQICVLFMVHYLSEWICGLLLGRIFLSRSFSYFECSISFETAVQARADTARVTEVALQPRSSEAKIEVHTQTSFIIMSNKGRLPASGLGVKRPE
jgi:hypothetical protein